MSLSAADAAGVPFELENAPPLKPNNGKAASEAGAIALALSNNVEELMRHANEVLADTRTSAARPKFRFPDGFVWGTATSAYQIEGGTGPETGRGRSIWDDFCDVPGAIQDGSNGAIACDHYNNWKADIAILRALNVGAYRFSIAWPRVLPMGRGSVNLNGLDFYDKLVDGLLDADITPFVTLYHWDLPSELERKGGWRERDIAEAFADYCSIVAQRIGDRVQQFTTFNEPYCIIDLGHRLGVQAPGAKEPEKTIRQITHHLLLAHGLGCQAIRAAAPHAQLGFVHNPGIPQPLTESPADLQTCRRLWREMNAWLLDPVFGRGYPQDQWEALGQDVPTIHDGDMKTIGQPLDTFGLNAYFANCLVHGDDRMEFEPYHPRTDMGWPITPDCLYWGCRFLHEDYAPENIYITESGCAYPDQLSQATNGHAPSVLDYSRVSYLRAHVLGVHRGITEGLPIRGYFAWSLMDNFEWAYGIAKRFGLYYINYQTQERIPKLSAKWFAQVASENGF